MVVNTTTRAKVVQVANNQEKKEYFQDDSLSQNESQKETGVVDAASDGEEEKRASMPEDLHSCQQLPAGRRSCLPGTVAAGLAQGKRRTSLLPWRLRPFSSSA